MIQYYFLIYSIGFKILKRMLSMSMCFLLEMDNCHLT